MDRGRPPQRVELHRVIPQGVAAAAVVAADLAASGAPLDCGGLHQIIEGCYLDETTPDETLLQWHILNGFGAELPAADLQLMLAETAGVVTRPKHGKRNSYVALLEAAPRWFGGFMDQADSRAATEAVIPVEAWQMAAALLLQGDWPICEKIQHERFCITAWLQRHDGVLATISFGRVLHVVHCVISSKTMLGKREGRLVPYPLSEEFEKQENARNLRPTGLRGGEDWVASWDDFTHYLTCLLLESSGTLSPSSLKRLFRARFQLELSETAAVSLQWNSSRQP